MRRLLLPLASLVALAVPASAGAFTFYEWEAGGGPVGIAQVPGGPLSVTFETSHSVGQVSLGGVQSAAAVITGAAQAPRKLAVGPEDGTVWFVDQVNDKVGRTVPGSEPVTLAAAAIDNDPVDLVASANKLMWVIEAGLG